MLKRQIQIFADIIVGRHGFKQFHIGFIGIHIQRPQPFHPIDCGGFFHERRQAFARFDAVAGGILGDEDMFLHALSCQHFHFGKNAVFRPGTIAPANQGNGAIGAFIIAAIACFDISGIFRRGQHPAAFQESFRAFGVDGALAV